MASHYTEELVDLIVAAAFQRAGHVLDDEIFYPSSIMSGFLAVLKLLSSFDFKSEALLIDINGEGTSRMRAAATKAFESMRETEFRGGPAMGVYLPQDASYGWDSVWSRDGPEGVVLERTRVTARMCHGLLVPHLRRRSGQEQLPLHAFLWNTATVPNPGVRITLNREYLCEYLPSASMLPSASAAAQSVLQGTPRLRMEVFRNLRAKDATKLLVGVDPVQSLRRELQEVYGRMALVLDAGSAESMALGAAGDIVLIFRPRPFLPRPFSVAASSHAIPLKLPGVGKRGEASLLINPAQVLQQLRVIGGDMVADVQLF
eukprot:scaffold2061_cov246-Pinguiococcus_pyrenoidosus.AAC.4